MERLAVSIFATLLLSCAAPDITGTWSYEWRVRDTGEPWAWNGVFHGTLVLEQAETVTGDLSYPDEDPATLFGDPRLRDLWLWPVHGTVDGDTLHLHAPAPNTAWDDPWWFDLAITKDRLSGPSYAGNRRVLQPWPFTAVRRDF